MAKASILVDVHEGLEVEAVEAWFARWRDQLTFESGNLGCGCCVDIWEVEGPEEAISDIPLALGCRLD
jgi:hypothetical protein